MTYLVTGAEESLENSDCAADIGVTYSHRYQIV